MARHRRSVALSEEAKAHLDYISKVKGVSANRSIELAVEWYSRLLAIEEREGGKLIGFIIKPHDGGRNRLVYLL